MWRFPAKGLNDLGLLCGITGLSLARHFLLSITVFESENVDAKKMENKNDVKTDEKVTPPQRKRRQFCK